MEQQNHTQSMRVNLYKKEYTKHMSLTLYVCMCVYIYKLAIINLNKIILHYIHTKYRHSKILKTCVYIYIYSHILCRHN